MDSDSYRSSDDFFESQWSAVASVLPSVLDSAAFSDTMICDNDLLEACKVYELPRVNIESDTFYEFEPIFLGAGASYRVYMQKFQQWEEPVAIKYIKSSSTYGNLETSPSLGKQRLTLLREVHSLCLFKGHPNIVNLLAWGQHDLGELGAFLVTEYTALGSLDTFLRNMKYSLTDDDLIGLCADVANGICAMHVQRMVHGDVKTANVLVFQDHSHEGHFKAKISDLGFSFSLEFDDGDSYYRGTDLYNAPEVRVQGLRKIQEIDSQACDVYSYGLLVWTVFKYGEFFLDAVLHSNTSESSEEQILDEVSALGLLEYASQFASSRKCVVHAKLLEYLLRGCLQVNSAARKSMMDICKLLGTPDSMR